MSINLSDGDSLEREDIFMRGGGLGRIGKVMADEVEEARGAGRSREGGPAVAKARASRSRRSLRHEAIPDKSSSDNLRAGDEGPRVEEHGQGARGRAGKAARALKWGMVAALSVLALAVG
jgi:hypothetical protein